MLGCLVCSERHNNMSMPFSEFTDITHKMAVPKQTWRILQIGRNALKNIN